MKNKKKLFLLLISTIFVWGFIIYKVFFSNNENDEQGLIMEKTRINQVVEVPKDSQLLLLDYQDPFLKTQVSINTKSRPKSAKKQDVKRKVSWPKIKYTGMIQNKITSEVRANITINNRNYIMKELDIRSDITLEEIHTDFIILSKNNVLKTINKPK